MGAAIVVENIVINLTGAVVVREMNQPIPPATRIVDRERTDERRAILVNLKHQPFRKRRIRAAALWL